MKNGGMGQEHMLNLMTNSQDIFKQLSLPLPHLLAMGRLLDCLRYPLTPPDPDTGEQATMDVTFMAATVAYHLARCGFDVLNTPLIHKREVSGPGIVIGACEWVKAGESTEPKVYRSPLDDLPNMTMAEINALPDGLRREAYKRLGLAHDEPGWVRKPDVNIEDAPDTDDGPDWVR